MGRQPPSSLIFKSIATRALLTSFAMIASLDSLQGHLSGLLAKTSASNAEGPQLDPGQVYLFGLEEAPSGGEEIPYSWSRSHDGRLQKSFQFSAGSRPGVGPVRLGGNTLVTRTHEGESWSASTGSRKEVCVRHVLETLQPRRDVLTTRRCGRLRLQCSLKLACCSSCAHCVGGSPLRQRSS